MLLLVIKRVAFCAPLAANYTTIKKEISIIYIHYMQSRKLFTADGSSTKRPVLQHVQRLPPGILLHTHTSRSKGRYQCSSKTERQYLQSARHPTGNNTLLQSLRRLFPGIKLSFG